MRRFTLKMPKSCNSVVILLGCVVVVLCQFYYFGQIKAETTKSGSKFNVKKLLCGSSSCSKSIDHESNYEKIDKYFLKNVGSNKDTESYMKAASEWLIELKKRGSKSKQGLVDALELLTSMAKIQGKCDRGAHAIVVKNNQVRENYLSLSRVASGIVKEYSVQHAEDCRQVYCDSLDIINKKIDPKIIERVRAISGEIFQKHLHDDFRIDEEGYKPPKIEDYYLWRKIGAISYIRSLEAIDERRDTEALYHALRSLAADDPSFQYLWKWDWEKPIREEKLKALFVEYVFEPCKVYVKEFGPEVYEPAEYDTKFYESYASSFDYYIGLSSFRVCQILIRDENAWLGE